MSLCVPNGVLLCPNEGLHYPKNWTQIKNALLIEIGAKIHVLPYFSFSPLGGKRVGVKKREYHHRVPRKILYKICQFGENLRGAVFASPTESSEQCNEVANENKNYCGCNLQVERTIMHVEFYFRD